MKKVLIKGKNILSGDVSGLWGNVDNAKLTDEERTRGIDIRDLIED